jgi:hypothetical protein
MHWPPHALYPELQDQEHEPPAPLQLGLALAGALQSAALQQVAAPMHIEPQTLPPEPFT